MISILRIARWMAKAQGYVAQKRQAYTRNKKWLSNGEPRDLEFTGDEVQDREIIHKWFA